MCPYLLSKGMAQDYHESVFNIAEEHYHPLLVHFPVALWPSALLFFALSFLPKLSSLRKFSVFLGVLGTAIGWIALESGEKAAKIVGERVCDQQLLYDYNDHAHTAFIIIAVTWGLALIFEVLLKRFGRKGVGGPWMSFC